MNLRLRFILINLIVLVTGFTIVSYIFFKIADHTVTEWGQQLAAKQLLYDKYRAAQTMIREVTLARQLAKSKTVIGWAENQNDKSKIAAGVYEMESFRRLFREGTYFVAFRDTGKYFFNDRPMCDLSAPYKYTLRQNKASDSWFYDIINENKEFHINVNRDSYLKQTKVWIDVLIKDKERILGVLGTGLDIDRFIKNFTEKGNGRTGMINIFTDHSGAVQVYFDKNMIDYASVTKHSGGHKSVFNFFNSLADQSFIADAMKSLPGYQHDKVISRYVDTDGKRYLASVVYIPELDWYEIALFDTKSLMNLNELSGIAVAFVITMILSSLIYLFALNRFVLSPVYDLEKAMSGMKRGKYESLEGLKGVGEIGRLINHFKQLSAEVYETTSTLEKKVAVRTEELNRLARIDPMTELLNRRGMNEVLTSEFLRAERTGHRTGLLWIDLDNFKNINDSKGHAAGDAVLIRAAEVIRKSVRKYDQVARWGGDEFIVMMPECNQESLTACGNRIMNSFRKEVISLPDSGETLSANVSVGGYLASSGETIDAVLVKADKALYEAKEGGRDQLVILD